MPVEQLLAEPLVRYNSTRVSFTEKVGNFAKYRMFEKIDYDFILYKKKLQFFFINRALDRRNPWFVLLDESIWRNLYYIFEQSCRFFKQICFESLLYNHVRSSLLKVEYISQQDESINLSHQDDLINLDLFFKESVLQSYELKNFQQLLVGYRSGSDLDTVECNMKDSGYNLLYSLLALRIEVGSN